MYTPPVALSDCPPLLLLPVSLHVRRVFDLLWSFYSLRRFVASGAGVVLWRRCDALWPSWSRCGWWKWWKWCSGGSGGIGRWWWWWKMVVVVEDGGDVVVMGLMNVGDVSHMS